MVSGGMPRRLRKVKFYITYRDNGVYAYISKTTNSPFSSALWPTYDSELKANQVLLTYFEELQKKINTHVAETKARINELA